MTILSYVAVFAGLGLTESVGDNYSAGMLVLGVFFGSSLWWLILSEGVTLFRKRISDKLMVWINRLAGLLIGLFGLAAVIAAMRSNGI